MNATMDAAPMTSRAAREVEPAKSAMIETTLFDLIAALQEAADPSDDAAVIAAIANLARTGRLRLRVPVVENNSNSGAELNPTPTKLPSGSASRHVCWVKRCTLTQGINGKQTAMSETQQPLLLLTGATGYGGIARYLFGRIGRQPE